MNAYTAPPAMDRRALGTRRAPVVIMIAVFLAAYLSWRPSMDIMFTASDTMFVLGLFYLMFRGEIPLHPLGAFTPFWLLAFGMMMFGLLIGSLFDDDPVRWVIVAAQYGFAWALLPFILMHQERDYTLSLAKALVAGLVAMEAFGIIVYLSYTGSFEEAKGLFGLDFISGSRRLGAFATDANWNGAAVSMALPFAFYLGVKRLIKPLVAGASIAVLMAGLVLSASFTAFVSSMLAIAIFVVVGAVRPRLWVILVPLVLAALAVESGIGLPEIFQKRVGAFFETGDVAQAGTFEGRLALVEDAWRMVEDHPIVGVGVDQFRVVSKLQAPVHNMYLLVWAEGGLLALAGWLWMMGILAMEAASSYRRDRLAAALSLSVLTTFLTFSTASPHMYARLWAVPVLLALAVARNAWPEADPARMRSGRARSARPRLSLPKAR